jgi:hypothetical protein
MSTETQAVWPEHDGNLRRALDRLDRERVELGKAIGAVGDQYRKMVEGLREQLACAVAERDQAKRLIARVAIGVAESYDLAAEAVNVWLDREVWDAIVAASPAPHDDDPGEPEYPR